MVENNKNLLTTEAASQWIDVMSETVGIRVTDEQRPGVIQNLQAAAGMADLTFSVPLDDFDPAPVFKPVEP